MLTFNFSQNIKNQFNETELANKFSKIINDEKLGFFKLVERQELISESKIAFEKFKSKKHFVHVGIGGSSLGTEMLIKALNNNPEVNFTFINNVDPDEIYDQLKQVNLKEAVFFFCSKSGGTAEPMAAMAIITNLLEQEGISLNDLKNHYVFATDPLKSELLNIGRELEIQCLEIPSNVGGRFSALSPVGLFPALFAKINIDELFLGAKEFGETLKEESATNPLFTCSQYLLKLKDSGINQTVLMPYSSKLRELSFWFTQLWAESLGKKFDLKGNIINTGLTPIPAYGPTDQHSQMQLFMEGPFDKCLVLLEVENFHQDFSLKSNFKGRAFEKLNGHKLSDLMKAEFHGTLRALKEAERPFIHISINQLNERTLASLILFFESLTALMGDLMQINPFDQPGVEAGKIFAYEFLEKGQ